ncbi:MAG: DMT family transporter [Verrucomicrobiae bacterium]|nr:DMT family transporter [Verrucomicrobiae bacterium]
MPWYLLLPLCAAMIYAFSSLLIKRGLVQGVTMNQSFHWTNFAVALVFAPLLLLETADVRWDLILHPLLVTVAFFLGTWLTFLSIRIGDVSLVTPLMGTKVVFVAIGVVILAGTMPPLALWIAAALTATGIFLMGAGDFGKQAAGHATAVITALLSAAVFGICDVLVRMWSEQFGAMTFLALSSIGVGVVSGIIWLIQGRPSLKLPPGSQRFALGGALLVGVQAVMMGLALSYFDDATGINVAYASRGLWAIVLVAAIGPMLGNHERHHSGRAFGWRIAGTVLLTIAIVLAVVSRM